MISVLHVIDKLTMDGVNPSSCALLIAEWILRHDPNHFKVMVANLRPPDAAGKFLEKRGIRVFYIDKGKYSFGNVSAIVDLIDQESIDIVHLHGYGAANFGRIAARRKRIPSVLHEHAILKLLPHQFIADWLLRNKTDVAVGVCEAVRGFMIKGRSIPPSRIHVIWNGINLFAFQQGGDHKVQALRQKFGVAKGQKLIGTVTRLREEKGNRYFIEAAALLRRKLTDARFVIVGDGPLRARLQELAQELEVSGIVHFAGFVNDVPPALAAFDIVVIPSLTEGFPLALAEAMAAGKPIVASAVGGIREMATHEDSALLIPPANSTALSESITRLVKDASFAHRLGSRAREVSESFGIERNVRALENLYTTWVSKRQL